MPSVPTPSDQAPPLSALAVLLLCAGTSVARVAQGAPVDALSLGLHFAASLALVRVGASLAVRRRARLMATTLRETTPVDQLAPSTTAERGAPPDAPRMRVPPAQRFDDVVDDPGRHPDCRIVPSGRGAWWRAPYAGVVFGVLLGVHALAVPLLRAPWTLGATALACAPLALFWLRGRATWRARRGVALVLTPEALIVRDARGARSAAWRDVREVALAERAGWDTLRGAHRVTSLVVERAGADPLVISEDDLAAAPGVVAGEIDRYRGAFVD